MQPSERRPADFYFAPFSENHKHPTNIFLQWFYIPFLAFGLLGLVWAVPVPHFDFLGKMNGYINLATFLILFATVFYLRLSFRLGLAMIVTIWVFSAGVIFLERMARLHGWPEMWQVCLGIFLLALTGFLLGQRLERNKLSFGEMLRSALVGPAWLWAKVFRKMGWRY